MTSRTLHVELSAWVCVCVRASGACVLVSGVDEDQANNVRVSLMNFGYAAIPEAVGHIPIYPNPTSQAQPTFALNSDVGPYACRTPLPSLRASLTPPTRCS